MLQNKNLFPHQARSAIHLALIKANVLCRIHPKNRANYRRSIGKFSSSQLGHRKVIDLTHGKITAWHHGCSKPLTQPPIMANRMLKLPLGMPTLRLTRYAKPMLTWRRILRLVWTIPPRVSGGVPV